MTKRHYAFSMSNRDQNRAIQPSYFSIVLHDTDGWEHFDEIEVNGELNGNELEIEIEGQSHCFLLPEIEQDEEDEDEEDEEE